MVSNSVSEYTHDPWKVSGASIRFTHILFPSLNYLYKPIKLATYYLYFCPAKIRQEVFSPWVQLGHCMSFASDCTDCIPITLNNVIRLESTRNMACPRISLYGFLLTQALIIPN